MRATLRQLALGFCALLFLTGDSFFVTEQELECEQAASYLARCCPGFDAHRLWCTEESGCPGSYPALAVPTSKCLQGRSCEQLQADGWCRLTAPSQGGPVPTCP